MKKSILSGAALSLILCSGVTAGNVYAETVIVQGTDVLFLAGRDDVTIPPLDTYDPNYPIERHDYILDDFIVETFPKSLPVSGGTMLSFEANGGVHYTNGTGTVYSPDGWANVSNLDSLAGISGYMGPKGALSAVFLDDNNPVNTTPPASLSFYTSALGTSFDTLSPELGQIFFIGNGTTTSGIAQIFTAPEGATQLFLGNADGWSFKGAPGYYEDNDGSYTVEVTTISIPTVSVMLDIAPSTLNLKSQGNYVTAYIEPPESYLAADIDVDTIQLTAINGVTLDAPLSIVEPAEIGDYDENSIYDLMVKFDRQALIPNLEPGTAEITLTGVFYNDIALAGSASVRVIDKGKK